MKDELRFFRSSTFFLRGLGPREKIDDKTTILIVDVFRQFGEQVFEISLYTQMVCLGGFNEAIDDSAGVSTFWRVDRHPILAVMFYRT